MLIAGDDDVAKGAVSFRYRNGEQKNGVPVDDAIAEIGRRSPTGCRCDRRRSSVPTRPRSSRRRVSAPRPVAPALDAAPDGLHQRRAGHGRDGDGRLPVLPRSRRSTTGVGLVVARGEPVYAVLNLHPYNPGHLMVVPYRHVGELEDLTADEAAELSRLHPAGRRRDPVGVVAARLQRRAQPRATSRAGRWPTTCTSTSCRGGAGTPTS